MSEYRKLCNKVSDVIALICGALLTVVLLVCVSNIILRNVFNYSWLFSQALLKLAFVWMVFLGAAVVDFKADHLKMDFVSNKFSKKMTTVVDWATMVFKAIVVGIMIYWGFKVTKQRMAIPFPSYKKLATGWMYLAIPVCGLIMVFFNVEHIMRLIKTGTFKEKVVRSAEEIKREEEEIAEGIKEMKEMNK